MLLNDHIAKESKQLTQRGREFVFREGSMTGGFEGGAPRLRKRARKSKLYCRGTKIQSTKSGRIIGIMEGEDEGTEDRVYRTDHLGGKMGVGRKTVEKAKKKKKGGKILDSGFAKTSQLKGAALLSRICGQEFLQKKKKKPLHQTLQMGPQVLRKAQIRQAGGFQFTKERIES